MASEETSVMCFYFDVISFTQLYLLHVLFIQISTNSSNLSMSPEIA